MDTSAVSTILEVLAAELERPREITAQVRNHLTGTYGLTREAIGPFLAGELPKLEDYEIDLILSPLFTPTLDDQAVFAERLGRDSVPVEQWPEWIAHLVARPTRAPLVTEDGQTHSLALRAVTVERFVRRLRLDATIPEPLFKLLTTYPSASDRPCSRPLPAAPSGLAKHGAKSWFATCSTVQRLGIPRKMTPSGS